MKFKINPHHITPYFNRWVISFLACVWVMFATSCQKPDYRISLTEMVAIERVMAEKVALSKSIEMFGDVSQPLGPYKVGPGDVLEVTVINGDQRGGIEAIHVRVDRNGEIEIPMVGSVRVFDQELEDVENSIYSAFVPDVFLTAVVHVELFKYNPTNVLVIGSVIEAGLVPLRRTERNMLFAIVGARGISEIASGQVTLRRIHQPDKPVTFDLTDPIQLQKALSIAPLDNGDILEVHAADPNTIFVGGLVNRASPQNYPPGAKVTILQAIAAAGGLRTDVGPKEGTLIRRLPNGSDAHVKLNLDRLATGEDPNIYLASGDILWIPETFETRLWSFINQNLFFRAGVSVNYNVTGIEFLNRASTQNARFGGSGLQDSFDPLGFLNQNSLLQNLNARP